MLPIPKYDRDEGMCLDVFKLNDIAGLSRDVRLCRERNRERQRQQQDEKHTLLHGKVGRYHSVQCAPF